MTSPGFVQRQCVAGANDERRQVAPFPWKLGPRWFDGDAAGELDLPQSLVRLEDPGLVRRPGRNVPTIFASPYLRLRPLDSPFDTHEEGAGAKLNAEGAIPFDPCGQTAADRCRNQAGQKRSLDQRLAGSPGDFQSYSSLDLKRNRVADLSKHLDPEALGLGRLSLALPKNQEPLLVASRKGNSHAADRDGDDSGLRRNTERLRHPGPGELPGDPVTAGVDPQNRDLLPDDRGGFPVQGHPLRPGGPRSRKSNREESFRNGLLFERAAGGPESQRQRPRPTADGGAGSWRAESLPGLVSNPPRPPFQLRREIGVRERLPRGEPRDRAGCEHEERPRDAEEERPRLHSALLSFRRMCLPCRVPLRISLTCLRKVDELMYRSNAITRDFGSWIFLLLLPWPCLTAGRSRSLLVRWLRPGGETYERMEDFGSHVHEIAIPLSQDPICTQRFPRIGRSLRSLPEGDRAVGSGSQPLAESSCPDSRLAR